MSWIESFGGRSVWMFFGSGPPSISKQCGPRMVGGSRPEPLGGVIQSARPRVLGASVLATALVARGIDTETAFRSRFIEHQAVLEWLLSVFDAPPWLRIRGRIRGTGFPQKGRSLPTRGAIVLLLQRIGDIHWESNKTI